MARIINNTDVTLSPSSQQAIHNAAANYGTDTVHVAKAAMSANETIWDIYNAEGEEPEYIATLDTEGDVLSNMR